MRNPRGYEFIGQTQRALASNAIPISTKVARQRLVSRGRKKKGLSKRTLTHPIHCRNSEILHQTLRKSHPLLSLPFYTIMMHHLVNPIQMMKTHLANLRHVLNASENPLNVSKTS